MILKFFKILILSLAVLTINLNANECKNKKLDMSLSPNITSYEILAQLANICRFSIALSDSNATNALKTPTNLINISRLSLDEIIRLVAESNDLSYEFNDKMLSLSYIQTKTFKMDYIISARQGQAITKASVDSAPIEIGEDYQNSSQNDENNQDNIIKTTEKFDFWQDLANELKLVLNSHNDPFIAPAPIINPAAGLIHITGTANQLQRVQNYLNLLSSRLKKQVLIDVKIISVELDNSYTKGVDWSKFELGFKSYLSDGTSSRLIFNKGTTQNPAHSLKNISGGFIIGGDLRLSLDGVLNFLSTNGKSQIISSPKIMAMNNQQALISVGDNINYRIAEDITNNDTSEITKTTYKQHSVFIGILLNLLPEISDENRIMLRINPSLSSFKYSADDAKQTQPRVIAPDTMQKKLSTVVEISSGDSIILGGLIAKSLGNEINKVPILGDIPLLGYLFKSDRQTSKTSELIFIITPTIINGPILPNELGFDGVETFNK
jgi:general secretion pathway protein D